MYSDEWIHKKLNDHVGAYSNIFAMLTKFKSSCSFTHGGYNK